MTNVMVNLCKKKYSFYFAKMTPFPTEVTTLSNLIIKKLSFRKKQPKYFHCL